MGFFDKGGNDEILFFLIVFLLLFNGGKGGDDDILFFLILFLLLFYGCTGPVC